MTAVATSISRSEVRGARRATAVVFAVHGCVTGSFAARVPWIASHVGVGVGHLGLALLMPGVGALLAMPFSGGLAHRYALRPLVTATIVAWCAGLVLPALPTTLALLCVVLLVFGAAAGLADMAMNAEGVLVEKTVGRSVMSSFHGFWSLAFSSVRPFRRWHPMPASTRSPSSRSRRWFSPRLGQSPRSSCSTTRPPPSGPLRRRSPCRRDRC